MDISARLPLSNGTAIPQLGLGTWKMTGQEAEEAVAEALEVGYRHFDTAKIYGNEESVGRAIRESGLRREEIWVTTKLWPGDFAVAEDAFEESWAKLGIDYVDLYLVHWPGEEPVTRTWRRMEKLAADPRVKAVGVSNHSVNQLRSIFEASRLRPMVNQIPMSVFDYDPALVRFCQGEGIVVEAYSPLNEGRGLDHPVLLEIGRAHGKTPAQVLIRWCFQKGVVTIPKSANRDRIRENADIYDVELSDDEMVRLEGLNRSRSREL